MFNRKFKIIIAAGLSFTLLSGFGLKDITKELGPDTDKCEKSSNKSKCKNEEYLKSAAKIAAVTVAAKLIYEMVIDYKTEQVTNDKTVTREYKKQHGSLPEKTEVLAYDAKLNPNSIVEVGKPINIDTSVKVVVGKKSKKVLIEEKLEIFDNEKTDQVINSLTKKVSNGKGGAYENTFSFTLPEGMPQGVYPIKTSVILDGKAFEHANSDMQVVMEVLHDGSYQIAYNAK